MIVLMFSQSVQADTGPKPSTIIDFIGIEGITYYAALLSGESSAGPHLQALTEYNKQYSPYKEDHEDYEIFRKFVEYKDEGGFYFLQFFSECTLTNKLIWQVFPPGEFKILLYFPESDSFIISDKIYERYAFDSYFTVDLSGMNPAASMPASLSAHRSYNYKGELFSLILRILLTIAIEYLIAHMFFAFREKYIFRFIAIVNIITQVALNLALNYINYRSGLYAFILFYVLFEFAVFAAESIIYIKYLIKSASKRELILYSLSANAASFVLGIILASMAPNIF